MIWYTWPGSPGKSVKVTFRQRRRSLPLAPFALVPPLLLHFGAQHRPQPSTVTAVHRPPSDDDSQSRWKGGSEKARLGRVMTACNFVKRLSETSACQGSIHDSDWPPFISQPDETRLARVGWTTWTRERDASHPPVPHHHPPSQTSVVFFGDP